MRKIQQQQMQQQMQLLQKSDELDVLDKLQSSVQQLNAMSVDINNDIEFYCENESNMFSKITRKSRMSGISRSRELFIHLVVYYHNHRLQMRRYVNVNWKIQMIEIEMVTMVKMMITMMMMMMNVMLNLQWLK